VTLTITASNGRTCTSRRLIHVVAPASVNGNFTLEDLSGNVEEGWSGTVRVFDATPADYTDHAPVLIYEQANFGGTAGSVGYETNRANVKFFGYVVEGSVRVDPETNDVSFSVVSSSGLLQRQYGWPTYLQDAATAADWADAENLDMNRAYHFFLRWHTTLMEVADVRIQSDTTLLKVANYPQGTPWDMLKDFAYSTRLARPAVDKNGTVHIRRDPQYQSLADRAAVAEFCTLQHGDWQGEVAIPDMFTPVSAWIDYSGVTYSGTPADELDPILSRAPMEANPKTYGGMEEIQYAVLNSQSEANIISGMILAQRNNRYPEIPIAFLGNWSSAFDPALQEYLRAPVAGWITKRGTLLANVKLLVRQQSLAYDGRTGVLLTQVNCEAETSGPAGQTYTLPEIAPPTDDCPPGTVYNSTTGLCEEQTTCPPGTVYNPSTGECDENTTPSWRSHIILAFASAGVYEATDVTPPTDAVQPTWNAVNTGLHTTNVTMLIGDPWDPGGRQYCIATSGAGALSVLYVRTGGGWSALTNADTLSGGRPATAITNVFGDINIEGFVAVYYNGHMGSVDYRVWYRYSMDFGVTWSSQYTVWQPSVVNTAAVTGGQFDYIGAYKGSSTYAPGKVLIAPCALVGSGATSDLRRSFDKGLTWATGITTFDFDNQFGTRVHAHIDPGSQDTVFVVGYDTGGSADGIYRSTDHGLSFGGSTLAAGIAGHSAYSFSVAFNPSGRAVSWRQTSRSANTRLYRTDDEGVSYKYNVFSQVPTNQTAVGISIVQDSPMYLYVMATGSCSNSADPPFFLAEDTDLAEPGVITVVDKSGAGGTKLPGTGGGIASILQVWA
jgi:hypothetical protein